MRALVITAEAKYNIDKVKEHAMKNVLTTEMMLELKHGKRSPIGDNPNHVCKIFDGYRIVYSIEQTPTATVRHMSVSVDKPKVAPNIAAVQELMKHFDFANDLKRCMVWNEEIGQYNAINVVEKIGL